MQRVVIRDGTPAVRLQVEDHDDPAALFALDAFPVFMDRSTPQVATVERDEAAGQRLRLEWQADVARGMVSARNVQQGLWEFRCTMQVTQDFISQGIGWSFRLAAESARVLSENYRMVPLRRPCQHNGLTPMALQARSHGRWLGLVAPDGVGGHDWQPDLKASVTATVWFDYPLAHPRFTFEGPQFRNWHNDYRYRAGCKFQRSLYLLIDDRPIPLIVPGRYPARHRAAFSITDHADHDSNERVAALWYGHSAARSKSRTSRPPAGFVGLRLPFTKSVFTATPQSDGAGLHNARFADLCREGHDAGIEICPHGVHSTEQPAVEELEALLSPFAEFKPLTWIDHGNRFLSNYGRRGWDSTDEYALLPWLDRLGIKYIWGRLDFGQSPPRGQLDQMAVESYCGWSYIRDLPEHAVRSLRARRPWAILHSASALAFQLIPERTMLEYFLTQRSIQRVMKLDVSAMLPALWHSTRMLGGFALPPGCIDVMRHLGGVRRELSRAPVFFPEHDAVYRGMDDRWLFNTVAVHDVAKAYSGPVVDRLLDDYGVHLSHTYLTSISRAHVSHAIRPDGAHHWSLTPEFDRNLKGLAALRDEGRLWVASMGEMGEFWRIRHQVRVVPTALRSWQVSLPSTGTPNEAFDLQVMAIAATDEPGTKLGRGEQSVQTEPFRDRIGLGVVRLQPDRPLAIDCY